MTTPLSWAVITPSYNLDFKRCALLCQSMDHFLTGSWHHYIVVDPVDLPLFAALGGPRRSIINKADILAKGMHFIGKVPFMRLGRVWWSWRHGLVFGWQMQQIVKISMASYVKQDALAFWDSDVFFLKHFEIGNFARNEKIRFCCVESEQKTEQSLMVNSVALLGLSGTEVTKISNPDSIVIWHRKTAVAMQDYLSELHHKPWHEAIGSKLMFSEYNLYMLFVKFIQKSNPFHYQDNQLYCKTLWEEKGAREIDVANFCSSLAPEQVAVCFQSALGLDMGLLEQQLDQAILRHEKKLAEV